MFDAPSKRDAEVNEAIAAIRGERNHRRLKENRGKQARPNPRYQWDGMRTGPYAAYDVVNKVASVDVLGLMYDLGYHATKPGGEAVALMEIEKELKRMASERICKATSNQLQMFVAAAHSIMNFMEATGALRRAHIHERKF